MSKKNFDIYVALSSTKLSIGAFKKFDGNSIFFKEYNCVTNLNKDQLNFENTEKTIEKNIFEIEKETGEFLNDIYLMIGTPESISINLSLIKDNEGKKIQKKNVQYLIQDAKQQILRSYYNKKIIHIIISNYVIDNIVYNSLPLDINCKKFSIDIQFICFPSNLIKKLEELFNNHQIFINKIICSNYAKSFTKNESCTNICESGLKLIQGINKQEVIIVPRKLEKKGFFEKLFHFFK
jgi:cell division protein FtsA